MADDGSSGAATEATGRDAASHGGDGQDQEEDHEAPLRLLLRDPVEHA